MNSIKTMTISEAAEQFADRKILVPAFKERFTLRPRQIENLFGSILLGVPLGSFIFWSPGEFGTNMEYYDTDPYICGNLNFYTLENKPVCPAGTSPRWAVLDGAWRLCSLCIGLKGALKIRRHSEGELLVRKLYLRLCGPSFSEDEELSPDRAERERNGYFRFLSEKEFEEETRGGNAWVSASRILSERPGAIIDSLPLPSENRAGALSLLETFSAAVSREKNISFSAVEGVPAEDVFDFYCQTLYGWYYPERKCKGEMFLSLAAQRWQNCNPREEFRLLKAEIKRLCESCFPENGRCGFYIDADFIVRICLYLTGDDSHPSFRRFLHHISGIGEEWEKIKQSIITVYGVHARCGWSLSMNYTELLPAVHWIYKNKKFEECLSDEDLFLLWIWAAAYTVMDGFTGLDGGYELAFKLRKTVDSAEGGKFPLKELCAVLEKETPGGFSHDGSFHLSFEEYLEILLHEPCNSDRSMALLLLIRLAGLRGTPDFSGALSGKWRQVHLHPAELFTNTDELNKNFHNAGDILFASNASNWNSVLNQRLDPAKEENSAETEKPLAEWAAENNVSNRDLFLDDGVSLDIKDFRAFIENRKKNITAVLRDLLR